MVDARTPDAVDDVMDATAEAGTEDGEASAPACSTTPPQDAGVCCTTGDAAIWCGGTCMTSDCFKCPTSCRIGQICCKHGGGAMCKVAPCP